MNPECHLEMAYKKHLEWKLFSSKNLNRQYRGSSTIGMSGSKKLPKNRNPDNIGLKIMIIEEILLYYRWNICEDSINQIPNNRGFPVLCSVSFNQLSGKGYHAYCINIWKIWKNVPGFKLSKKCQKNFCLSC